MVHARRQEAGCFTQNPGAPVVPTAPSPAQHRPSACFTALRRTARHPPARLPSPARRTHATRHASLLHTVSHRPQIPGNHGFARSWPVQHAQRGCFTRLRRTAPAPRQGLCNRPRRHGASCFTGGDGGVRHRDDPGTPNETSPPGMFHRVAWARPGPGRDAGDKGGCRLLGQGQELAAPARPVRRCNPDPRVRTGRVPRPSSRAVSRTASDARGGPGIRPSPPARRC